jgi:hypothetical protein
VNNGLSLGVNAFGLLIEIFSDNLHTIWSSIFGNGVNVGQIYENPEGGYYKILSLERHLDKSGNRIKDIRMIELYRNLGRDEKGNYIGIDKYGERRIETNYLFMATKEATSPSFVV